MQRLRKFIDKVPTGLLSGITLALILWLTLAPHPTGDLDLPLFPGADKIVHVVMFGFLTFMVLLEFMKHRKWTVLPLPFIGAVAFTCAVLGIGIELIQKAMGMGRSLEVLDMLADAAGAFGVAGLWAFMQGAFVKHDDTE